jgi:endoglucanase
MLYDYLMTDFVTQQGTQLADGLKLRGVNLGGWLLWEGWIWGGWFDYVGETTMMNNLTSLVGAEAAEKFRADVRANFITSDDFAAISAYGFNVARVPFNYRLLETEAGWAVLDQTIAAAKEHDVYLVLDLHAAPNGQTWSFTSDHTGWSLLWWSPSAQDRTVALWRKIAARYADETTIAGYDLLNESVTGDADLLRLYKRITAAIREVDKNHMLIYEGNDLGRTFSLFTEPLDANQALSIHDYPWMIANQDVTARMPVYDAAAQRLNSPLWVGEFGQGSYEDINKYITIFEADPLVSGWAQWTWKQVPGFPALQTLRHTAASKKLIEWMNNTGRSKPTAAEATQGMSDFAKIVRFENTLPNAKLGMVLRPLV